MYFALIKLLIATAANNVEISFLALWSKNIFKAVFEENISGGVKYLVF
jgi:hypothetical protein